MAKHLLLPIYTLELKPFENCYLSNISFYSVELYAVALHYKLAQNVKHSIMFNRTEPQIFCNWLNKIRSVYSIRKSNLVFFENKGLMYRVWQKNLPHLKLLVLL